MSGERRVTVRLVKHRRPAVEYQGVLVSDDGTHLVVAAPWTFRPVDLGVVRFEPGDQFTEHYWRDRWYSVKEVAGADGALKGWYCDTARPAVLDGDVLVSADLELDLWIPPDRREVVHLDEDEFAASGLSEEDPVAAAAAVAAVDELERLARLGMFPFR